jgi:multiple sugar transport system substrate-binding protein
MNILAKRTVGLLAGILLVAACGSSSTPTPTATAAPTAAPTAADSGAPAASPSEAVTSPSPTTAAPVTLEMWVTDDPVLAMFKDAYEKAHPNVTVDMTVIPEDLYTTKLATAFAGGEEPDIAILYDEHWMKANKFVPIDDVLKSAGVDTTQFAQTALSSCQLDGKLYCIGSYTGEYVNYYDKDLFDAAGLAYPSATENMTVDDYAAIARKLSKPDPDLSKRVYGATTGGPEADVDNRVFVSDDGRTATGFFDDAPTTHMMTTLAHMANDKSAITWDDLAATGIGDGTDLMPTHQIGITPGDNTALSGLLANGVRAGVAPPYKEQASDPFWVPMWTDMWGVLTNAKQPDAAKDFLVWVATEGNKVRAEEGYLPLNLQMAKDMNWAGGVPEKQALVDMAAQGRPFLRVPGFAADISPIIDATWSSIVDNESKAEAIMHDGANTMQDQLNKDWATWDGTQ